MTPDLPPVALVEIPERKFVALVFSNPPGRRLRFLFAYRGELRAVSWLHIGRDGSLYLNARSTSGKPIVHGTGIADGLGGFKTLEWDPASPALEDNKNRKVSYHASGRTKGGARMSTSISLRTITKSTLIRQDDYAHPSQFEVIADNARRAGDIVVLAGDAQVALIDDDPAAQAGPNSTRHTRSGP